MGNDYIDKYELLRLAIKQNDKHNKWLKRNGLVRGDQYVKKVLEGNYTKLPQINERLFFLIKRIGEGFITNKKFSGYSEDWKEEMLDALNEAIVKNAGKFDVNKKKGLTREELARGCFNYFTKLIQFVFIGEIKKLKAKKDCDDKLIMMQGTEIDDEFDAYEDPEDAIIRQEELKKSAKNEQHSAKNEQK